MAASQTLAVVSPHSDLVTSLLFSPQSTHLATSSLDSQIRIVQRNPSTQTYDHDPVIFKAHDGPVLSLAWSPPQLGLILASGGVDGSIKIWKQPDQSSKSTSTTTNRPSNPHSSTRHSNQSWISTSTLTEPRGTIRSLGFSPSEFGLKLAAVSSDARLRVWECLDPVKAQEFTLVEEIDLNSLPLHPTNSTSAGGGAGNASNNFGNGNGTNQGGGGGGNDNSTTASGTSGTTGNSSSVTGSSVDGRKGGQNASGGTVESDGGWSLSWCREHWWGERLAVSSGINGIIRLFHFPSQAPWSNFLNLYPTRQTLSSSTPESNPPPPYHLPPTSSLNWAPPSGRSFQLLASGSKDSKVRVYKVYPPSLQGPGGGNVEGGEWTAQLDVELDESVHYKKGQTIGGGGGGGGSSNSSATPSTSTMMGQGGHGGGSRSGGIGATRVEWNVTGTVLSTSGGEDGIVRLWKSTYTGQWRQITSLKTETSSSSENGGISMDQ